MSLYQNLFKMNVCDVLRPCFDYFCALFIQKYDYNNSFNIYLYLFSCSFGPFCSTLYENPDDCHRSLNLCIGCFLIYLAITKYVPVLVNQTTQMINSVVDFYQSPHTDTNQVLQFIDQYLEKSNLLSQLQNGASMILRYIQDIGAVGLSFVMSFILSFFFMIEKKQMADFSKLFLKSDFDWFSGYLLFCQQVRQHIWCRNGSSVFHCCGEYSHYYLGLGDNRLYSVT